MANNHPKLVENEFFRPHDTAVISVPQKAPNGAITRTESALNLLERVKRVHTDWVTSGHRKGQNTNNVSATITVKPDEGNSVGEWMWNNRKFYNGLSILPFADHTYKQAPYTDCTKEQYNQLRKRMPSHMNWSELTDYEKEDTTVGSQELACSGDVCEVVDIGA